MADGSGQWWDQSWNPVTGCTPVSAGCEHCWAKRQHARRANGKPFSEIVLHRDRLDQPLHWRKLRRVAVCLMGDLFHPGVPEKYIVEVFNVMYWTRPHFYFVLTKRPKRMAEFARRHKHRAPPGRLPNVALGTSVEDQATADERIPHLLECPAAMRFVSVEPMLGPVRVPLITSLADMSAAALNAGANCESTGIRWVIVGSESGPGARPMKMEWCRSVCQQCVKADVPFFFKQRMDGRKRINMPELAGRVWDQMPKGMRNVECRMANAE